METVVLCFTRVHRFTRRLGHKASLVDGVGEGRVQDRKGPQKTESLGILTEFCFGVMHTLGKSHVCGGNINAKTCIK